MNTLISSGSTINLSNSDTYVLKTDEVFLNGNIYKKKDLEIAIVNNYIGATDKDVLVGIQKRDGVFNRPSHNTNYEKWIIDNVQQTSLSLLTENINTILQ